MNRMKRTVGIAFLAALTTKSLASEPTIEDQYAQRLPDIVARAQEALVLYDQNKSTGDAYFPDVSGHPVVIDLDPYAGMEITVGGGAYSWKFHTNREGEIVVEMYETERSRERSRGGYEKTNFVFFRKYSPTNFREGTWQPIEKVCVATLPIGNSDRCPEEILREGYDPRGIFCPTGTTSHILREDINFDGLLCLGQNEPLTHAEGKLEGIMKRLDERARK